MDILDHFWGPQTASCPKVTIYLPLTPRDLQDLLKTLLFWPNFDHFGTLWGSWGRLASPAKWAAFGLEDLLRALANPCLGPQILVILTTFPIEKVNFCHFAYQGQWKCHFDPILTPFWALLSPNFDPSPKCAYLFALEGPWRTLRDPNFDP